MKTKQVKIFEQGNGLPEAGDFCMGGGQLYQVVSMDSRIQTGDVRGNWVYATVSQVPFHACEEADQHTARVDDR